MIGGGAVTGLAVGRADAMSVLRNLDRSPLQFRQRRDQASDHAGLAHAARMSANDDDCHRFGFRLPAFGFRSPAAEGTTKSGSRIAEAGSPYFFASRASVANCFRYSRRGCAGVPQNATPLPRRTLLGRTPPWPPSMTPASM